MQIMSSAITSSIFFRKLVILRYTVRRVRRTYYIETDVYVHAARKCYVN